MLFPKVISRVLREAAEPMFLVTPLLDVVRVTARSMEFPAVNAIQADEVPEGQEYPEQKLAFQPQRDGKGSKKGVKVGFTEEVIADSQWDIVGLHVRAAGRAMARLKEQIALKRFAEAATIVHASGGSGLDDDGSGNDTLTWNDVIDMAAVLHAENHVPTDFILHPLMWAMFLKAAPFQNINFPPLGWNQSVSSKQGTANSTAPLGLNVILSPFVNFTAGTPAKSDVFLIDRNEIGALMVRDEMSTDEWGDDTRDLRYLKLKERYDIVCYGDGEGITVAKDVALAASYDVQLTKAVSP